MSISLKIEYKDPEKQCRYILISSQKWFRDYWSPICVYLKLRLLPLIETGYPVIEIDQANLPDLIYEVLLFIQYRDSHPEHYPEESRDKPTELLLELIAIQDDFDAVKRAVFC